MASAVVGTLRVLLEANAANLEATFDKASIKVGDFDRFSKNAIRNLTTTVAQFSGQNIVAEATRMAAAVEKVGGVSSLTAKEIARVTSVTNEAVAKLKALGAEVPPSIAKLHTEIGTLGTKSSVVAHALGLGSGGLGGALKALGPILPFASIAGLSTALIGMGRNALNSADQIVTLSNKTGLSTERIQQFQFVAGQTGTTVDALAAASFKLGVNIENGTTKARAAIAQLGLSYEDLKKQSPEQQFDTVIGKLEGLASETERNAIGAALFGKGFSEVVTIVAEGYTRMKDEAVTSTDGQIRALEQAGDALDKFQRKFSAGFTSMAGAAVMWVEAVERGADSLSTLEKFKLFATSGGRDTEDYLERLRAIGQGLITADQQTKAFEDALKKQASQTNTTAKAVADYSAQLAAAQREVSALSGAQRTQLNAALKLGGEAAKDYAESIGLSEEALRLYQGGLRSSTKAVGELEKATEKAETAQRKFLDSVRATTPALTTFLRPFVAGVQDAGDELQNIAAGLEGNGNLISRSLKEAGQRTAELNAEFHEFDQTFGVLLPKIEALGPALSDGTTAAQRFGVTFSDALQSLGPAILAAVQGGGSIVGTIGAVLGKGIGDSVVEAFGESIVGAFGKTLGGAINALIPGVGALLGPLFGKIVGFFGGRPLHEDIARRVSQWAGPISEGLSKAIAEVAKEFHDNRQAAEIFSLNDIIGEAGGLNASNLTTFTARLRDVFVMIETGAFTSAQAMEVLEENWEAFAEAGTNATGRLSEGLREILRLAQQTGTVTQAMTDYLRGQNTAALEGWNDVIAGATEGFEHYGDAVEAAKKRLDEINAAKFADLNPLAQLRAELLANQLNKLDPEVKRIAFGIGEATEAARKWKIELSDAQRELTGALKVQASAAARAKEDLSDLGVVALGVFGAAIENGQTFAEALRTASPGLTALSEAYADLGLTVEDTGLRSLLLQNSLLTNTPQLVAGVEGLTGAFTALANTSQLNATTFAAMQRTALSLYTRIQGEIANTAAATGDLGDHTVDALIPMQALLHRAEEEAKRLNVPLEAGVQSLIDQSRQLGIWQAEGEDANDILRGGFEDVGEAITDVGEVLRGVGEDIRGVVGEIRTLVSEMRNLPTSLPNPFASWTPGGSSGVSSSGAGSGSGSSGVTTTSSSMQSVFSAMSLGRVVNFSPDLRLQPVPIPDVPRGVPYDFASRIDERPGNRDAGGERNVTNNHPIVVLVPQGRDADSIIREIKQGFGQAVALDEYGLRVQLTSLLGAG